MKTANILRVALAFVAGAALLQQTGCTLFPADVNADIGGPTGANGVMFSEIDSNSDGKLTRAETQDLLAMQNFARQDTNDDGLLSEPEYGRNGSKPR